MPAFFVVPLPYHTHHHLCMPNFLCFHYLLVLQQRLAGLLSLQFFTPTFYTILHTCTLLIPTIPTPFTHSFCLFTPLPSTFILSQFYLFLPFLPHFCIPLFGFSFLFYYYTIHNLPLPFPYVWFYLVYLPFSTVAPRLLPITCPLFRLTLPEMLPFPLSYTASLFFCELFLPTTFLPHTPTHIIPLPHYFPIVLPSTTCHIHLLCRISPRATCLYLAILPAFCTCLCSPLPLIPAVPPLLTLLCSQHATCQHSAPSLASVHLTGWMIALLPTTCPTFTVYCLGSLPACAYNLTYSSGFSHCSVPCYTDVSPFLTFHLPLPHPT